MGITPADLTTTVRSRSDTILKKIITGEGRQTITGRDRHNLLSEAMPEWKDIFTESQIEALIAYLRFLSRAKYDLIVITSYSIHYTKLYDDGKAEIRSPDLP